MPIIFGGWAPGSEAASQGAVGGGREGGGEGGEGGRAVPLLLVTSLDVERPPRGHVQLHWPAQPVSCASLRGFLCLKNRWNFRAQIFCKWGLSLWYFILRPNHNYSEIMFGKAQKKMLWSLGKGKNTGSHLTRSNSSQLLLEHVMCIKKIRKRCCRQLGFKLKLHVTCMKT